VAKRNFNMSLLFYIGKRYPADKACEVSRKKSRSLLRCKGTKIFWDEQANGHKKENDWEVARKLKQSPRPIILT